MLFRRIIVFVPTWELPILFYSSINKSSFIHQWHMETTSVHCACVLEDTNLTWSKSHLTPWVQHRAHTNVSLQDLLTQKCHASIVTELAASSEHHQGGWACSCPCPHSPQREALCLVTQLHHGKVYKTQWNNISLCFSETMATACAWGCAFSLLLTLTACHKVLCWLTCLPELPTGFKGSQSLHRFCLQSLNTSPRTLYKVPDSSSTVGSHCWGINFESFMSVHQVGV